MKPDSRFCLFSPHAPGFLPVLAVVSGQITLADWLWLREDDGALRLGLRGLVLGLSICFQNLCSTEGAEGPLALWGRATRSPPPPDRLWLFSQLSEWWLRTAYLQYRQPLVIYSSPGLVLPRQDFVDLQGQLR